VRKLIVLALVGVVLVAVDQGARIFAEGKLAARAGEAASDESATSASITSFPFLGRLLVSGTVPKVRVRVDGPRAGALRLSTVVVEASGVALDRSRLTSGEVRVEDIDSGSVAVEVDGAALAEAVNLPVTIGDGRVGIGVGGATVAADAELEDGTIVLRVAGVPALRVPVVRTELVPCRVTTLAIVGDRVRLACEVDELPEALRR
jgi:hypothetical protein